MPVGVRCRNSMLIASLILIAVPVTKAQDAGGELTVHVDQPGATVGPMFYGLMTEEINHAYDGGLYAELIQNRIFKDGRPGRNPQKPDPANPPHWSVVKVGDADGSIMLDDENPVNTRALTTSLRLDAKGGAGRIGVANDGYWGIPVKPNTEYKASFYARAADGFKGPLKLAIEGKNSATEYASATVDGVTDQWKKFTTTLKTGDVAPSKDNRFVISAPGDNKGSIWFNLVSLFPPTYHNRPNGLRIDIMEKLADMHPAFLRFPGGNYVEGNNFEGRFNWKATIGPLEERPGHHCPWSYRSSDGLGLLEFLEWCEDLKMEPVLAVYAGLHLDNGRTTITGDALKPFVQEALEEIEYVTGDTTTQWGARRAKDDHPEPFKLTYVEIGNEDNLNNGGRTYDERFGMFYDAIKGKYPNLKIISTIPPNLRGGTVSNLSRTPDVVDDHLYNPAEGTMRNSTRHNMASREGPKVFMGEWASNGNGQGTPTPNMHAALGDAAFLGGLERNSDLVVMECYAPLFVNVNPGARQWPTNLIGYDALTSFGSPSYYVQKMYRDFHGDRVLPVDVKVEHRPSQTASADPQSTMPRGRVGVGTWATRAAFKDMKVTSGSEVLFAAQPDNTGDWRMGSGDWKWEGEMLSQLNPDETNCRALVGSQNWTDYTYTLKARKISGAEGFLILFHVQGDNNWLWWNVGGWGNTRTAIQKGDPSGDREIGGPQNVTVEAGRWYDVKIEVEGRQIRCYLDGDLKVERMDPVGPAQVPPAPVYAAALRDSGTGNVVIRVVNTEMTPRVIKINLTGVQSIARDGELEVIAGQPTDVNTVDEPTKLSPKKEMIEIAGTSFVHEFPAQSVTVQRLKAQ